MDEDRMMLSTFAGVIDLLEKQEIGLSSLTVTPAKMDAMPTSSSMGPSLRRDDECSAG
jgi:hypothetical protein